MDSGQTAWAQIPALPLADCVNLGEIFNLSEAPIPIFSAGERQGPSHGMVAKVHFNDSMESEPGGRSRHAGPEWLMRS